MTAPKKPAPDDQITPEQMSYSTPKLDPETGAPLDTRFPGTSQGAAASKQSPKSEAPKDKDEEDDSTAKDKNKSRSRR